MLAAKAYLFFLRLLYKTSWRRVDGEEHQTKGAKEHGV